MKHTLLLFLLICFSNLAYSQTTSLNGVVTDEHGQTIAGATVTLKELNRSTLTDDAGRYELSGIAFGDYTLLIHALNLQRKQQKITVTATQTVFNVQVKERSDRNLEQVNVQGKTEKRKIETSGFAVNVVDTKQAALRNLQTNELLNRTVGVRVRQVGGFGSNADYNLNGMSGRAIGIFIDGIEISTYGSSFNLNNIPPAMIERIEVYKGVLPAHLAGDYLGGGINVILKKGVSSNNLTASVSYGSFNTQQADVSGTYRNSKNGFTVRGSGFYGYSDNDYEVWSKWVKNEMPDGREVQARGKRFNDAFKTYGGRFEAGFTQVKWADQLMINYNGSYTYKEIQHGQFMTRPYNGRFAENNAHIVGLNYAKKDLLVKGLNLNFNGVYSNKKEYIEDTVSYRYNWDGNVVMGNKGIPLRTLNGGQQGLPTLANINREIFSLRAGLSYQLFDGHQLTFTHGFYAVQRQDSDQLRTILQQQYNITNDLTTNVSALNYEIDAFENRLKTNAFVKYYQQSIDRTEPVSRTVNGVPTRVEVLTNDHRDFTGYGFAASYALTAKWILIASAEKAVRMPSEGEIFGNPTDNMLSNVSIKPETSNNYNLGFRAGSFALGEHRITLSASGFIRDTKNKIMQRVSDRAITVMPTSESINLNGTLSRGFEAELNYAYRHLNVALNTSRFNTLLRDPKSLHNGNQIPNEPFFTINGNAQYRFNNLIQKNSSLNLYYNFGYVHPFDTHWNLTKDDFYQLPTQFIQDLGASYLFPNKKLVVSFDAKNILNKEAYDNFAAQRPGRAFYLKFNYTINNF